MSTGHHQSGTNRLADEFGGSWEAGPDGLFIRFPAAHGEFCVWVEVASLSGELRVEWLPPNGGGVEFHLTPDQIRLVLIWAKDYRDAARSGTGFAPCPPAASAIDGLTGLPGWASAESLIHEAANLFTVARRPLSLLLIDGDDFKGINARHGFPLADEVLRGLGRVLSAALPPGCVLTRMSADQFAAVLFGIAKSGAIEVGESLRVSIAANGIMGVPFTVSVGVASLDPSCTDGNRLLRYAWAALDQAKRAGRNRVSG